MYMERVNAHLWVLPSFFLMIAILLFFYDYNVVSKINEKEAMQAKGELVSNRRKNNFDTPSTSRTSLGIVICPFAMTLA